MTQLKRSCFLVFSSALIAFNCFAQASEANPFKVVNVQALLLWNAPHPQVESLNAQFPFLETRSLSVAERRSLGEAETQVIYGETVQVIEAQDGWVKLRVPSQKTFLYPEGYEAWSMSKFLSEPVQAPESQPEVIVRSPRAALYADQAMHEALPLQLSYGTRLKLVKESSSSDEVVLVGGSPAFIEAKSVQRTASDGVGINLETLVSEAKRFLGLRYVWGGTSSEGFDCSGFIYRLFSAQERELPRNASDQAKLGVLIARDQIKAGDLIFFKVSRQAVRVDHVGLAINEHQFIHSPSANSAIKISDLNDAFWLSKFYQARHL